MEIKGRPFGLWLICLSLIFGVIEQLYYFLIGFPITLKTVSVICLSLLFIYGLFTFNKWVCIVFVFLCGLGALTATTAAILVLGTNSIVLGNNWSAIFTTYWLDIIAVLFAYTCVYYLTRSDLRSRFIANKLNQPRTSQSDAPV